MVHKTETETKRQKDKETDRQTLINGHLASEPATIHLIYCNETIVTDLLLYSHLYHLIMTLLLHACGQQLKACDLLIKR